MDRVRTALVGCGKVGQIHAQALAALPESEFVAVCDVDVQRATSFATRFGVQPYSDVARMLDECGVQAICIATPHPLHAEPAIAGGQGGRARSGRKATGRQPERLRRHARGGATTSGSSSA